MRENLSVTSRSMAFTDCMNTTDLATEKKGIKFALTLPYTTSSKRLCCWPCPNTPPIVPLSLSDGKTAFCVFLKSEFCEENIEFWTACEDFRNITSRRELVLRANSIYEEFIKSEAPKEINLDFHTRKAITQSLGEPSATTFLAAQNKVYSLMENNSYPRFIHSDLYKELCAAAKGEGKHIKS
uniref:Regulator of G protein signaling 2 n=1 Tax=Myripristis murdjan TaxID=586833 RepID=A0A667ZN89_9TELE